MGYQNFFATRLGTEIGSSDTVITLENAPAETTGRLVLEARNPTQREIISYTGVSGNQLTGVTRGLGGTSAKAHLKNALVEMNLTAEDIRDLYDAFNSFSAAQNGGWFPLAQTPTLTNSFGNGSFEISIPTDLTGVLSRGSRLRIPRVGTQPTQSASFNGTTQHATRPSANVVGLGNTPVLTVSAWVYITEYKGSTNTIASRYIGGSNSGYHFYIDSNGCVVLAGREATKTVDNVSSIQAIPVNRWVHVAAAINVGSSTGRIFIDGVEVPTTYTNGTSATISGTGDLAIGQVVSSQFFSGRIAQFQQWHAYLTAAQVRQYMNQELTGSETNLVGYWKLNGNWNDSTANANHLTPQGSPTFVNGHPFGDTAYAIVMNDPTFSAGNTTLNVHTANGYAIPNSPLGAAHYSQVKVPHGFPAEPDKWTIINYFLFADTVASVGTNVWTKMGKYQLTLPVGAWALGYHATVVWVGTASTYSIATFSLSSSATTDTLPALNSSTAGGTTSNSQWRNTFSGEISLYNDTLKDYYPIFRLKRAGNANFINEDITPATMYAINAYL